MRRSDTHCIRYVLSILFFEPECYEVTSAGTMRFIISAVLFWMSFPDRQRY